MHHNIEFKKAISTHFFKNERIKFTNQDLNTISDNLLNFFKLLIEIDQQIKKRKLKNDRHNSSYNS